MHGELPYYAWRIIPNLTFNLLAARQFKSKRDTWGSQNLRIFYFTSIIELLVSAAVETA